MGLPLLGLLRGLLGLASKLASYLESRQLLEAGEARAVAKGAAKINAVRGRIARARRDAANGVRDDPYLRD